MPRGDWPALSVSGLVVGESEPFYGCKYGFHPSMKLVFIQLLFKCIIITPCAVFYFLFQIFCLVVSIFPLSWFYVIEWHNLR